MWRMDSKIDPIIPTKAIHDLLWYLTLKCGWIYDILLDN